MRGHVFANIISLLDTPSLCISFAICSLAASSRTRLPVRTGRCGVGKAAGRAPSPRLGGQRRRCRARSLWRRGPGAASGHRRFLARAHARPPQPPSRRPHLRGRLRRPTRASATGSGLDRKRGVKALLSREAPTSQLTSTCKQFHGLESPAGAPHTHAAAVGLAGPVYRSRTRMAEYRSRNWATGRLGRKSDSATLWLGRDGKYRQLGDSAGTSDLARFDNGWYQRPGGNGNSAARRLGGNEGLGGKSTRLGRAFSATRRGSE